jgi:hypothetical protein
MTNIPQIPAGGFNNEVLQGKEPSLFDGNQLKTDSFIHELRLYQFVNATHPIMIDCYGTAACGLCYVLFFFTLPDFPLRLAHA